MRMEQAVFDDLHARRMHAALDLRQHVRDAIAVSRSPKRGADLGAEVVESLDRQIRCASLDEATDRPRYVPVERRVDDDSHGRVGGAERTDRLVSARDLRIVYVNQRNGGTRHRRVLGEPRRSAAQFDHPAPAQGFDDTKPDIG